MDLATLSDAQLAQHVFNTCPKNGLGAYARAYCHPLISGELDTEGRRVQWLYVRSNLSAWRGADARACKAEIDRRTAA